MAELNVALSTVADGSMLNRHDDNDKSVISNRQRFLESHGISFEDTLRLNTDLTRRAANTNSNFCTYEYVDETNAGDGIKGASLIVADAIVTDKKNLPLMLPVADCIGAVLFDPSNEVLMMSHLGRHSLEQQGALRSVEHLVEHFKSNPADIKVWLTPAAGKEEYPIWALHNKGMKEAALEQLETAGIRQENLHDDSRSTTADTDFYSYSEFLKGNRKEDGDHMIAAVML